MPTIRVDLSQLEGVTAIDKDSLTVTVKSGTTWRDLNQHLKDLKYESCIIPKNDAKTLEDWLQNDGINIAGFKFGPTGRALYDIEIVTFQGDITNLGYKTTLYDALGYELKRFFLGSQNTLGISTEAIIQIRPVPETKRGIKLILAPEFDLTNFLKEVNKKTLIPTLMVFLQDENRQLNLYMLIGGASEIVAAQVSVLKAILEQLANHVYNEISADELLSVLYKDDDTHLVYYLISPAKFSEFLRMFNNFTKAYQIDRNSILVGLDLSKLGMSERDANAKVLSLKGNKAYINPLNEEELVMFGEDFTPELVNRVRLAFNPKAAKQYKGKKK